MAQSFKETAHLKTDLNKYAENYDRIFGKKNNCEVIGECFLLSGETCKECSESIKDLEATQNNSQPPLS